MNIIKYLLENFDIDGCFENDVNSMIEHIRSNFSEDDCVEFANIIVTIENLPKILTESIWSRI